MSAQKPIDYLANAYEALNNDYYPPHERERTATAQALATMGILQQLTRIADMIVEARAEDAANAAEWKATSERMHRRQRENLEDSYRGD
jgi:hypothetical protein